MIARSCTPLVCLFVLAAPAAATSVAPMTLAETAAQAGVVQRATVAARTVAWGERQGQPAIVTRLTFTRVTTFKGAPVESLQVFGGEVGDRSMRLIGQPELRVGDEVYLFLERDGDALPCPFVGVWRGVFTVREGQVTHQGRPLKDLHKGTPALAKDNERGMTRAAFEVALRQALRPARRAEAPIRLAPPVTLTPIQEAPAGTASAPPTPIEELASGSDEEALAGREGLTPAQAEELPLGFSRPASGFTTRGVEPSRPASREEER